MATPDTSDTTPREGEAPAEPGVSGTDLGEKRFPCGQCGAKLTYQPGVSALQCEYCGFQNAILDSPEQVQELDFHAYLAAAAEGEELRESPVVQCAACGAQIERAEHSTAFACPFCGVDVVAAAVSAKYIKPKALLPFHVPREDARAAFGRWLSGLWFAPDVLVKRANLDDRLNGMYVPYWTYDCDTISHYEGQRGDDYWDTERYTTTENGRSVTKTRQVRKTRWRSVSGVVQNRFDDVLIAASRSLPDKYLERLEPWDLENLAPYADEYLSGFAAESYQVDLGEGFEAARKVMDNAITISVCQDIGGDHQRIHSVRTRYDDITFKHILLPIWISTYSFKGRAYRFLVNGRTGEVQGERPWSAVKITLFVLSLVAAVGLAAYLIAQHAGHAGGVGF